MPIRVLSLSLLVCVAACSKETRPDGPSVPTTAEDASSASAAEPGKDTSASGLADLQGSEWKLVEWNDGDPVSSADITLVIDDNKFAGKAACNRYFVPVTEGKEAGEITVGEGGLTKMLCDPAANDAERRYLDRLSETTRLDIVDGNLSLSSAEGRLLFQPVGN